VEVEHVNQQ